MKYLLKSIWVLLLVCTYVVVVVIYQLYYWGLYPLYHLRWPDWKPRLASGELRDFREEVYEFWYDVPPFYPGWTAELTNTQINKRIRAHYASYLAYCKEQHSYDPK